MRHKHQAKRIATSITVQAERIATTQAMATFKTRKAQENNIPKIKAQKIQQAAEAQPNTRKGRLIRAYLGL